MKVLVVGNITLDISFDVEHLPRPGETVLARSRMVDAGGKGLNQAVAAARAGAPVVFCSAIGGDSDNLIIMSRLRDERLDTGNVLVRKGFADESIIYLSRSGENCIVSTDAMAKSLESSDVDGFLQRLEPHDILLMQGNLSETTTMNCIRVAHSRGARVVVNLAPIEFTCEELWPSIDYLVVNEIESSILSGKTDQEEAARYLAAHGISTVITTLGGKGALLVTKENEVVAIPAPGVSPVDTTGAGDVFTGVFVAGLARSLVAEDACKWAVRAASLSVTRRGTLGSFPSPDEMVSLLERV